MAECFPDTFLADHALDAAQSSTTNDLAWAAAQQSGTSEPHSSAQRRLLPGSRARLTLDEQQQQDAQAPQPAAALAEDWAADAPIDAADPKTSASTLRTSPLRKPRPMSVKRTVVAAGRGRAGCGPDWSTLAVLPTKAQLVNMVNSKGMVGLLGTHSDASKQ